MWILQGGKGETPVLHRTSRTLLVLHLYSTGTPLYCAVLRLYSTRTPEYWSLAFFPLEYSLHLLIMPAITPTRAPRKHTLTALTSMSLHTALTHLILGMYSPSSPLTRRKTSFIFKNYRWIIKLSMDGDCWLLLLWATHSNRKHRERLDVISTNLCSYSTLPN
jgi:hypothetical protein